MTGKKIILAAAIIIGLFPALAQAEKEKTETITITTYYPAPYGAYKELRTNQLIITPQDTIPAKPVEGMIFFSNGSVKDEQDELMQKGLWVYMEDTWYPLAVSLDQDSMEKLNREMKKIFGGNQTLQL